MRADETDIDDAMLVTDGDDEPVLIAFDVEYDPIACNDAGVRINARDIVGRLPCDAADILVPGFESRLNVIMLCPVAAQCASGNYSHGLIIPCSRDGNNADAA